MGIVDLIFPKTCLVCGRPGVYICKTCVSKVRLAKGKCIECEKPSIDGMTHAGCKRPWGMEGCICLWRYEKVIRQAILKLKYKFAYGIADELAGHIVLQLKNSDIILPKDFVLVPIPLHKLRSNWRGFNQVEEVGKLVAEKMKWDYRDDILMRKKHNKPQTELKGKQRSSNILGVFAINPNYQIPSTNYLLFDDVITTGSTLKEAGKELKRNGAKKVWGLTIAG